MFAIVSYFPEECHKEPGYHRFARVESLRIDEGAEQRMVCSPDDVDVVWWSKNRLLRRPSKKTFPELAARKLFRT